MDFEGTKEKVYSHYSNRIDKLLTDFSQEKEAEVCSKCENRDDCNRLFFHLKTLIGLLMRQSLKRCLKQNNSVLLFECLVAPLYAMDNLLDIFPCDGSSSREVLTKELIRTARRFIRRWSKRD